MADLEKLYQLIMEVNPKFSTYWARKTTERLLASGVVVLPCKPGDTVYISGHRFPAHIDEIVITETDGIAIGWSEYERGPELTELWDAGWFSPEDFGKTVFLTKEEAEKALKQMVGGGNNAQ